MDFSKVGWALTAVSACQRGESSSVTSGSSDATALRPNREQGSAVPESEFSDSILHSACVIIILGVVA